MEINKMNKERSTRKLIFLGLMSNFSSMAPSMSLGFSAVVLPILLDQSNPHALTISQASWFASITSLATPFGAFFSGPISDRFGRRYALFCINIVCFIGWLVIASAFYLKEYQFLILLLGRLLTGLSTGLSSMPATVYMSEISSINLRGIFTTWSSIFFSLGVLTIYVLGLILKESWEWISLITAVFPCVAMFFAVFLIPESPTWLVNKGRYDAARKSLASLYASKNCAEEVETEIKNLIENTKIKSNTISKNSILDEILKKIKSLLKPNALRPFLLMTVFVFFQQFAGVYSLVFYAINIVKNAGIKFDPYATIVLIGLVRFFSSLSLCYLCHKIGRRPLSLFSGTFMAVCMTGLGWYTLQQRKVDLEDSLTFIPIILLLVYFFASTIGFLSMLFAMSAEVYPVAVRGTACGLTSCMAYFFLFITVKIYPSMEMVLHSDGIFFFYGGMAVLGTIFVYFFLPETKGKTFDEIEAYFVGRQEKGTEMEMKKLAA